MDKTPLHHNHPVIKRVYLYLFIITFLLLLIFVIVYLSNNQSAQQGVGEQATQKAPVSQVSPGLKMSPLGSMSLVVKDAPDSRVAVGTAFTLLVLADSEGTDIVGFDALLSYDPSMNPGTATTPLTSFKLFTFNRDGHLTFTATKSPNITTPTPFQKSQILTIPFTSSAKGVYTFSILSKNGKETTKMVDVNTKVFSPQPSSLKVTIY